MSASFLAGLPSAGPPPVHLHTGHPTPWSEGCVIRIESEKAGEWIANAQEGWGYAKGIYEWPNARLIVLIANGACYLISPDSPGNWRFIDSLAIECAFAPDGQLAIVSTYTDLIALTTSGECKWQRCIAVDGVQIDGIADGMVSGKACLDPPDHWQSFRVLLADGADA
jgi:hypothetical protein